MMGYKAWVGGKSTWVSTNFGTAHNMTKHTTESENFTEYEHAERDMWRVPLKVGGFRLVHAKSAKAALAQVGEQADKRKRPTKVKGNE